MILLDTHVLLWFFSGNERLGRQGTQLIQGAIEKDVAIASAISVWEIGLLVEKKRFKLGVPIGPWVKNVASAGGIRFQPVSIDDALAAADLPDGLQGDPGDRLIVGTARALDCPLLTADERILDYAAVGHVKAIDARL